MRINIISDNTSLNNKIKILADKKLNRHLDKLLQNYNQEVKTAVVKVGRGTRWGWEVNFDLMLPGNHRIFADHKDENLVVTFTGLREKLEKQIKKYREKQRPY